MRSRIFCELRPTLRQISLDLHCHALETNTVEPNSLGNGVCDPLGCGPEPWVQSVAMGVSGKGLRERWSWLLRSALKLIPTTRCFEKLEQTVQKGWLRLSRSFNSTSLVRHVSISAWGASCPCRSTDAPLPAHASQALPDGVF